MGYHELLDLGILEIEPLTYIRGRSIPNQYIIVDEAQNLTPHEVKTIVTRVGDGTKIVLTGDPYQIDNPYVDQTNNGLIHVVNRFKNERLAGHITMQKGERSAAGGAGGQPALNRARFRITIHPMKRLHIPEESGARLEYPLDYGFTIIGLAGDDFPEHARRLVARFVIDVPAEAVSVRASARGKYHSSPSRYSSSPRSREAVYQALHEDERVVFVL